MKSLQEALDEDQSTLPDVHATSAGLKSYCTWFVYDAIDLCRQTLGGHGYSSYTRLGDMHADFAVMCTWEGDNTVRLQGGGAGARPLRLNALRSGPAGDGAADGALPGGPAPSPAAR